MLSVTLTGNARLDWLFGQLPPRVEKRVLSKALRPATNLIMNQSRANVRKRSGLLARSISTRVAKRKRKGEVRFQVRTDTQRTSQILASKVKRIVKRGASVPARLARQAANTKWYGAFVELGHHVGPRALGNARKYVPGQQFMKRAFDTKKAPAEKLAQQLIAQGIEEEARRG